jgi:hypothetical protein
MFIDVLVPVNEAVPARMCGCPLESIRSFQIVGDPDGGSGNFALAGTRELDLSIEIM